VGADLRVLRGDGFVTVASALGRHRNPRFDLDVPESKRFVAASTGHVALLASAAAAERMRAWLRRA